MVDDARFTELYQQFYARVLGYVLRRVEPDQARDVVDETFLIAWRRLPDIPPPVLPWLLVTARNLLSEEYRRGERSGAIAHELRRCRSAVAEAGVDEIVVERLTVLAALAELAEHDREALILTVWDGMTSREAARHVGCSVPTFAVRLHRARRRLADALDRQDADHSRGPNRNLVVTVCGDQDVTNGGRR